MRIKKTARNFSRADFTDYNGVECSLQNSSLATEDAIWLGCNEANPKQMTANGWQPVRMPDDYIAHTRMHLTRKQVKKLLPHLEKFVKTGEI